MVPVTTVTGALGSGKTTIIRSVLSQLPKEYKVVWLKNEFGDVQIDTLLSHESNVQTTEILNGCLCCVLVGKLYEALKEIAMKYKPDRLIIETAGTAYPYPIIQEINRIPALQHDGLSLVIDALNFSAFTDKSYIARQQSQFVDLVIINKYELISEDALYKVEDEVYDLYLETPKYKAKQGFIPKDILFGVDVKQIKMSNNELENSLSEHLHDEIETAVIEGEGIYTKQQIEKLFLTVDQDSVFRSKGIVYLSDGMYLFNWVLGRTSWEKIVSENQTSRIVCFGTDVSTLPHHIA